MGHVGRFQAVDGVCYPRQSRVICRTERGLELGDVLQSSDQTEGKSDGELLRGVTVEDDLLLDRIDRRKEEAYVACTQLLAEHDQAAVLMDVEHLFDGQSLYFYFLGEVSPAVERLTEELAETYETKVQFRQFTDALTTGCGPDCGTEDATGGGCGSRNGEGGGCSSCSVASACGARR
jgi:cell fate regulator YaaT (PSP1 superfamily)